ncbi:toxin Cry1Ac domain D-VI-related protein [Breznakia pachnodae]|uniref:Pesticidal crystal protein Cry1Aa domain-containing protein n=1 Tax=Breznakia pachnodae TaxID=265178 RepID=A0ABU0E1F5_9FIRM|nr:toxin Cry1Ac domain D-VI-related protein [Breznakia pachnodae]MDQ0360717.1 hypothetical protein [Breznakia pachnodae]
MKKRIKSKKLISSLAISTLVLGLFVTTVINADETDVITEPEIQEVEETTEDIVAEEEQEVVEEDTTDEIEETIESDISSTSDGNQIDRSSLARVDLTANAFPESSRPLEQAIITQYNGTNGTVKVDTDDNGYISVGEANTWTSSTIRLDGLGLTGTITGIENFTNLQYLHLYDNNFTGTLPEQLGNLTSLKWLSLYGNSLEGKIPASMGNISGLEIVYLSNNNFSGDIPEELKLISSLKQLNLGGNNDLSGNLILSSGSKLSLELLYIQSTDIKVDLSGFSSIKYLSTTEKNISNPENLSKVLSFNIAQKNIENDHYSLVRLTGTAGFVTWDDNTKYYVIAPNMGVLYDCYISEGSIGGPSAKVDLSQGGLMDTSGNLIIGATVDNVIDGSVVLPNGGTVVTPEVIYSTDGNMVVSESEIEVEGNVTVSKNTLDGSTVTIGSVVTEVSNPTGGKITIPLGSNDGTTLKPGTIVTNNDGDKVFISDEAIMDNEGNITSSGTYVTVPSDKTATTNSDGTITLPENSIVTVNGEDTVYPGTIIFSPEDGSLKYIPVSELLNEDGTDLATGITQKEIDDARTLVDGLTEGNLKDQLTEIVDTAQNILKAKEAVEDLFTDGSHIDIPDDLTQTDIDKAQELVNKVPDGKLKDELQKDIDKAQDMLNARDKVNNLFTDDTHTDIPDDLTQTGIDDAQKAVDKLPSGDLKDELQKEIDKAQDMLDAKNKVDDLFTDGTHTDITDGLTQKDIDKAQDAVDKLPDGALKDELQKEIDKAQDMLNAKDAVGDLLDKDGNLNSDVTQKDIDKAQELVNKLPDGDLKDELQAVIDEAQRQLDAQNKKNPSTAPSVVKPSVSGGATTGGSAVNTADTTNTAIYFSLLVSSIVLLGLFIKRRKHSMK